MTVAGITGAHMVLDVALALTPAHTYLRLRLAPGTIFGHLRGGDTLPVEAWRCHHLPVDLEDHPA